MQKMLDDIEKATEAHEKLKKDLSLVKAGKTTSDGKNVSADVYAPPLPPLMYTSASVMHSVLHLFDISRASISTQRSCCSCVGRNEGGTAL